MAFAPADTTETGVSASSRRSAEMSNDVSAPACTPPMPPVAKTSMPARCAQIMVAATVVAPVRPVASATARSARESFIAPDARPSVSSSSADNPMWIFPPSTAIVAGAAPAARTSASTSRAVSTFCG